VSALQAGTRYVVNAPSVRRILLRSGLFVIPGSALWALLPVVAHDRLGMGAAGYGGLLGALGVGAVLGALTRRLGPRPGLARRDGRAPRVDVRRGGRPRVEPRGAGAARLRARRAAGGCGSPRPGTRIRPRRRVSPFFSWARAGGSGRQRRSGAVPGPGAAILGGRRGAPSLPLA
jgi:hypothetical protein